MLAQAKYDTRTVRNALWRPPPKPPAKLSRHARIEDLRRRVGLGRVRLSGCRCLRAASLGLGQPQVALRLGSSALLLGRGWGADRGSRRASPPPPWRLGPELRAARAHPWRAPRAVAGFLAGAARAPRPGRRDRAPRC